MYNAGFNNMRTIYSLQGEVAVRAGVFYAGEGTMLTWAPVSECCHGYHVHEVTRVG